ncbi:AP endonuclease [Xylaria intraflava]|nr:AP endonuclease [Xylaria intraflava]
MPPTRKAKEAIVKTVAQAVVQAAELITDVAIPEGRGISQAKSKPRMTKRKPVETSSRPALKYEASEEDEPEPKPVKRRKTSAKSRVKDEDSDAGEPEATPKKPKAGRAKAKAKHVDDATPLAERTAVTTLKRPMYIGAHVSSAGGVQNSITNTVHIGANAFALFLKSQRKWANPPLDPEARDGFIALSKTHKFEVHRHCLPHGSYLINLAQAEKEKAGKAYDAFVDDLHRCEALGIKLYNFHPGSTNGDVRESAIGRIAAQLNKAHKATSTVVTVLENMAGQGNIIGGTFEDLRDIIALIEDKSRVGVCIDTCHAFAAGYDLRSPEAFAATMSEFDEVVGTSYLRALHLNDSKAPLASHRDLHANIGTGFLGLRAFHNVVNYDSFAGLPMVLETPIDRPGPNGKNIEDKQIWADEIKLLERLIDMDPASDEFTALEEKLQADGASERNRVLDQVNRKSAKDKRKGKKTKVEDDSSE